MIRNLKIAVFLICLLPLARLVWLTPGAVNPVEFVTRSTGTWALIGLLVTLSVSPLRQLTGRNELIKFRRMLGLFSFFYACLHFTTWLVLDHFFDFAGMWRDVYKRPFITVGFSAFMLLIPLAITSNDRMVRKLKRNWTRLHKLVYPIGILVVVHYWWLVKRDLTEPAIYATVLLLLLLWRIDRWQKRRAAAARQSKDAHLAAPSAP
ncbi:protein-methionine-sulfoxide reductase heme-binding subunit MsrQ [Jeongeupia sp. HS-3]|uniref:sulfite oxidase heme-binding subunit YedZ n=1 Tax=Jeongeupia sp. HS-3 TaxID=1009682 RepID=UPI0018A520F0|nr:protein-methionine-sulfoxide reductase heme-binding subunit MsrQ [Jeongeupia sp. HS-3]BCL76847.1 protein-methionine-sulfoxide reductase heme-binding subunit MsrQ [Jeongeupia sp. HS-3]